MAVSCISSMGFRRARTAGQARARWNSHYQYLRNRFHALTRKRLLVKSSATHRIPSQVSPYPTSYHRPRKDALPRFRAPPRARSRSTNREGCGSIQWGQSPASQVSLNAAPPYSDDGWLMRRPDPSTMATSLDVHRLDLPKPPLRPLRLVTAPPVKFSMP